MSIFKKITISALLSLPVLGLTISPSALADSASDAVLYCTSCHNGYTIYNMLGQTAIIGGGGNSAVPQRTAADWVLTIHRMNAVGAYVPYSSIDSLANYLAGLVPLVTTTSTSTSTSTTTSTTVSSTTTTTLCNTYVNGTTQYRYSGAGICHSYTNDSPTGAHIVRDQKYCQKHMTHVTSSGNHVHAYPHPMCM